MKVKGNYLLVFLFSLSVILVIAYAIVAFEPSIVDQIILEQKIAEKQSALLTEEEKIVELRKQELYYRGLAVDSARTAPPDLIKFWNARADSLDALALKKTRQLKSRPD
jgi:hypothetical protein